MDLKQLDLIKHVTLNAYRGGPVRMLLFCLFCFVLLYFFPLAQLALHIVMETRSHTVRTRGIIDIRYGESNREKHGLPAKLAFVASSGPLGVMPCVK